jgi:hypothetical protein
MNLLDSVRLAIELADKVKNVELKETLLKVRLEAVDQGEEVVRLRQENLELRQAAELRESLLFRDNVYWKRTGDGPEDGPFCQKCFDGGQRLVRLVDDQRDRWRCSVCGTGAWKPGGQQRSSEDAMAAERRRGVPRQW